MKGNQIQIADETQIDIISGIINNLEWLNEMPDGDWIDGHGDTHNKAESMQRTINNLRELVGFHPYPTDHAKDLLKEYAKDNEKRVSDHVDEIHALYIKDPRWMKKIN